MEVFTEAAPLSIQFVVIDVGQTSRTSKTYNHRPFCENGLTMNLKISSYLRIDNLLYYQAGVKTWRRNFECCAYKKGMMDLTKVGYDENVITCRPAAAF
jgi:hypothetical protein